MESSLFSSAQPSPPLAAWQPFSAIYLQVGNNIDIHPFPGRDKKERYKRQWEHRCPLSMVRRKLLATVIIAVNPRPSSSSEMSRLEILETASSSLTGNWLHVLC